MNYGMAGMVGWSQVTHGVGANVLVVTGGSSVVLGYRVIWILSPHGVVPDFFFLLSLALE